MLGCAKVIPIQSPMHVYTYLRIVMESICFVTGRYSREVPSGSLGRFSVTEDTLEAGLDPTAEKTSEVGYNDIHLDVDGRWQETLYTKICGVPETLLTLLSQTVKLANGKQRLEAVATSSKRALMLCGATQNTWNGIFGPCIRTRPLLATKSPPIAR
jgi:hypothetical protein